MVKLELPPPLQGQTILALNELGQAVTSSLKLEDVLLRIMSEVTALLKAEGVAILMPEDDHLTFVAVCGPGAVNLKGMHMPRTAGVAGYVMRTGEPVWLNDHGGSVPDLSVYRQVERVSGFSAGSLLAAPLFQGGAPMGVLEAAHSDVDGLRPEELSTLVGAANWAAIAIANAQLHEQAQRAREEQALLEERHRLARELHDAVTQSLYSMSTLAGAWRRQIEAGSVTPQKEHIAELGELAQQALREVRLLIYELRPTELDEEGLLGALYRRLEAVEQRVGVQTRLVVTDTNGRLYPMPMVGREALADFYRMPAPVEHGLYRLVQEALNNALKHSGATKIWLRIRLGKSTLSMELQDNGRGFEPEHAGSGNVGFGLAGMAERAQQLGGRFSITSSSDEGTTVRIEGVPYRFVNAEEMID